MSAPSAPSVAAPPPAAPASAPSPAKTAPAKPAVVKTEPPKPAVAKAAAPAGPESKPESKREPKHDPKPASLVAQSPHFVVGDTWQFVRTPTVGGDIKVTEYRTTLAVVNDREIMTVAGHRMTLTLASLNQVQNDKVRRLFKPHGISVRFPLAEGKTWTDDYEFLDAAGGQRPISRIKAKARVLRRETATVPAGAFDTLVVQHTIEIDIAKGGRETAIRTVWYSPEARAFVRTRYEKRDAKSSAVQEAWTLELKSYSVAR
ncbi:MAG: hypothetical protein KAY46_09040 [Burkholderiaceae bacterium]|nr:hypothetical protein [Burkholderiaceae bacterium]